MRVSQAALPLLLLLAGAAAESPAPRDKPFWTARHERKRQEMHSHPPDLIFVGDSIIQSLDSPQFGDINSVWRRFYACRNAINLGFAGDTTGNVLWRLQNGEIDGARPKLAVVLIGTNDISPQGGANPDDAAAGVRQVVATLHDRLPGTHILLLGLLPREKFEHKRQAVNADLAPMDWSALGASYLNIDAVLESDARPDPALYREHGRPLLHPNATGWERIAEAIEPRLTTVLGQRNAGAFSPANPPCGEGRATPPARTARENPPS